jgi:AcrR family transcriptional regulator
LQEQIIEKIEDKLFKDGFYKTTMDDVASELGMSKKTIYKFFPTKEILVNSIAKYFMNGMKSRIVPALSSNRNAIEKLGELIKILATATQKVSPQRMDEIRKHFPSVWDEIDKFRTKMMFENITKVIDQGKAEGLFVEYPTVIIMNVLVGSIRNVVNPDFITNNSFSIIEAAQYTFKIIIGGILTEKGKKQFDKTFSKVFK